MSLVQQLVKAEICKDFNVSRENRRDKSICSQSIGARIAFLNVGFQFIHVFLHLLVV